MLRQIVPAEPEDAAVVAGVVQREPPVGLRRVGGPVVLPSAPAKDLAAANLPSAALGSHRGGVGKRSRGQRESRRSDTLLAQGLRLVEARELLNEAMERGTDSGSGQAFVSLAFAAALTGDHVTARKGLEAFHDFDPSRASEDEGDDGELELQSSDKTLSDSCGKGIMADPKASVALFRFVSACSGSARE